MKLYKAFAQAFAAYQNCLKSGNGQWEYHWHERIETLCKTKLPHGSGFDAGTTFDFDRSKPERLVFRTAFHHMDEHGHYDGWTEHDVIVTPSLLFDFDLRVTGRDRNMIKEYIAAVFSEDLDGEAPE